MDDETAILAIGISRKLIMLDLPYEIKTHILNLVIVDRLASFKLNSITEYLLETSTLRICPSYAPFSLRLLCRLSLTQKSEKKDRVLALPAKSRRNPLEHLITYKKMKKIFSILPRWALMGTKLF